MKVVYMLPSVVVNVVVYSVWLSAVVFDVLYTLKATWWRTPMGWNLFVLDFCIALSVTPGSLARLHIVNPQSEFFQWFVVSDLAVVTLVLIHRIYLLWRAQEGWSFWGRGNADDNYNGRRYLRDQSAAGLRSVRGLRERMVARLHPDQPAEPDRVPAADSSDSRG